MPVGLLPTPKVIQVDTRGAKILQEESPETRDSRGIYFPNHIEPVSHIAVDIGGSLAKVAYFTRSPDPPDSPSFRQSSLSVSSTPENEGVISNHSQDDPNSIPNGFQCSPNKPRMNGALTPSVLEASNGVAHGSPTPQPASLDQHDLHTSLLRSARLQHFPGGSLNFTRFETSDISSCISFIRGLIDRSAELNGVSAESMRRSVKIVATGGGAHRFYELFRQELGVEVHREDEMECLITGLSFIALVPNEVYWFSDELVHEVSHGSLTLPSVVNGRDRLSVPTAAASSVVASGGKASLERPSPNLPKYSVSFESHPTPQLPCLLVNIGSGVSIIKVDEDGTFERVSGTSLGGGTLWGLLSLLTGATSFDEMLALSEKGHHETVDMLVGDIYGQDYSKLGLKSTMIASSFGKVWKKGQGKREFAPEDISKSLLYALSNNIGQIAFMNAEKYSLDRIYFGGCFIRGHAATIATLSYAIRFWSNGTKRALFLRHEGFLGAIGAWIKNIENNPEASKAA